MFRKAFTTLAFAMVVGSAACNNSIVGPKDITSVGDSPAPRTPAEHDVNRVCIDDLRGVDLVSPSESQFVRVGDNVGVSWAAREFCTGFYVKARVSYDDGATWTMLLDSKNTLSTTWRVPNKAHIRPVFEVTLEDMAYQQYTTTRALANGILEAIPTPGHQPPVDHD